MLPRLLVHYITIVICLVSVMLEMTAAYSPIYGLNKHFPYLRGGFEFLTESSQTRATAAVVTSAEEQLIAEIISQVSEQEIYQSVYDLQNFRTRVYGYPGNTAASAYIYDRFDSIPGLDVEYQGGDLRNVIATLPGLDSSSNEIYVAGAHYDSTSSDPNNAPGATDDAAGVAIVLEFARIMSQYSFNHTLKFACWNGEEVGHLGSLNYTAYASSNSLNIPLYVNLDSPAYDPYDRFILDIMYNSQSSWASDMLTEHNSLFGINFALTYNVHGCSSDHLSFRQYGYAAVMTHEETHGPAHTPDDTVDKVSTLYAKKNGQLCMSVLARVAEVINVEVHDVEILSVTPSKTVAGRGYPISIGLTVRNSGSFIETFTVTTKANAQTLNHTQMTLGARTSKTSTFAWNTTGFAYGNYTLEAAADVVPGETDIADNNYTYSVPVHVGVPGDVSGATQGVYDGKCDMRDINYTILLFNTRPSSPNWNPNADVNDDGVVNMRDISITITNFNKHE